MGELCFSCSCHEGLARLWPFEALGGSLWGSGAAGFGVH